MGWLALGQICVMGTSTVGFAVLARTVGPVPFATFATLIFIFTVCSLATDLSPQGFLLVHGHGPRQRSAAVRSAAVSAVLGGSIVLLLSLYAAPAITSNPVSFYVAGVLSLAVVFQTLGQLSRAYLLIGRCYARAAGIDVVAALVSVTFAVVISFYAPGVWLLCAQLAVYSATRLIGMWAFGADVATTIEGGLEGPEWKQAVRYGVRVLPLNVSSYLSRALDSGFLPAFLPSVAAASYARSFQVIVAPMSQVQLSVGGAILERLSRSDREGRLEEASTRVWKSLLLLGAACSVTIAAGSTLLANVLFGDGWPMARVFIAAMSCAIPGLFVAMYYSWRLQLVASARRSVGQLLIALLSPVGVLGGAQLWGTQGALAALVAMALVTPSTMAQLQFDLLPSSSRRATVQVRLISAWMPSALIFALVSWSAGFWTFSEWR